MANFTGTAGDDGINGTPDNDTIAGLDGHDFLQGRGGNDVVDGGAGDDNLRGNDGDDVLLGGDGNDLLRGGAGVDSFDGGADYPEDSPITGTAGDRISFYEAGATQGVIADLRTGIISNDGFGNTETMAGIEGLGSDTAFVDELYGNDNANWLLGGPSDKLFGFGGDDSFFLSTAVGIADGGAGNDTIYLNAIGGHFRPDSDGDGLAEAAPDPTAGFTVNLGAGTIRDSYGNAGSVAGIENVEGSELADVIIGNPFNNVLLGHGGDDFLSGGGGANFIDGGDGNDTAGFYLPVPAFAGTFSVVAGTGVDQGKQLVMLTNAGGSQLVATISVLAGTVTVQGAGAAPFLGLTNLFQIENLIFSNPPPAGSTIAPGGLTIAVTDTFGLGEFTGGANPDIILGSDEDEFLAGGGGNDLLSGDGGDDFLQGQGGDDVLMGGEGDDTLRGNDGSDVLIGGDGNDHFRGGAGVDSFDGGADYSANSPVIGTSGDRISFYEAGATQGVIADLRTGIISNDGFGNVETMVGIEGLGSDTAFVDELYGNDNDNWLLGGPGDKLFGFGGNDSFSLSTAVAIADGGAGNDTLYLNAIGGHFRPDSDGDGLAEAAPDPTAGFTVNLGAGTIVDGYGNAGSLANIENVEGSELADVIIGNQFNNLLMGHDGDDVLLAGGGSNFVDGGDGSDTGMIFFSPAMTGAYSLVPGTGADAGKQLVVLTNAGGSQVVATISTQAGTVTVQGVNAGAFIGSTSFFNIERLNINAAPSAPGSPPPAGGVSIGITDAFGLGAVIGGADPDILLGSDENEWLEGGGGNDIVSGDGGQDILLGLGGDDLIKGGSGEDVLRGHGGDDYLDGGEEDDYLVGGPGNDVLDGGSGIDRAGYSTGATNGVTVDLGITVAQDTGQGLDTLINIENLSGTRFDDTLSGDDGDNWIWGGSDGSGVTGNDTITADGGKDLVEVGSGNHSLDGGTGIDTVRLYGNGTDITAEGVTLDLRLQGSAQDTEQGLMTIMGFENVSGSIHDDVLIGDGSDNLLAGVDGNDRLDGGDGNDRLLGDGDVAIDSHGLGTSGPITVFDDGHPDTVHGDDVLEGGAGDDELRGGGGNDRLDGGAGNDVMIGGTGDDVYVINAGDTVIENAGEGVDEIQVDEHWGMWGWTEIENLTAIGTGDHFLAGNERANVITGNSGNNYIVGEGGDDTIYGGAGRDIASYQLPLGSTGTVRVVDGTGEDAGKLLVQLVNGEDVQTFLEVTITGPGSATVEGVGIGAFMGTDTVANIEELHILVQAPPNEPPADGQFVPISLAPAQYGDFVAGSDGNDVIDLADYPGAAFANGNRGDDQITGTADANHLEGGDGNDAVSGAGGNDSVNGNAGDDSLSGGSEDDYLIGQGGSDSIDGGSGFDIAAYHLPVGTTGSLRIVEGTGDDAGKLLVQRIDGASVDTFLKVTITDEGGALVEGVGIGAHLGTDSVANVEELHIFVPTDDGSPTPPDQFVGIHLATFQHGDFVAGSDGSDVIDLADFPGALNVAGNFGDDTIIGADGNNYVMGGAGNDTIVGNQGFDVSAYHLPAGVAGSLRVVAGSGADLGKLLVERLDGATVEVVFKVSFADDGTATVEGVGSAAFLGTDTVSGVDALDFNTDSGFTHIMVPDGTTAGRDDIFGWVDSDVILGGAGHDGLRGQGGDDVLLGGTENDFLVGGLGNDLIDGGAGVDRASYYHENPALGGANVSLLLQGFAQNTGSGGIDLLIGIEHVTGTVFADTLTGDENANWLWGIGAYNYGGGTFSTNNDTLSGGGGDDLMTVGIGNHVLDGGDGNDTVEFFDQWLGGGVTVSLALQGIQQATGSGSVTITNVENLAGSQLDDHLEGNDNANTLAGSEGNDTLTGAGGDDLLLGDGYSEIGREATGLSGAVFIVPSGPTGNDILDGGDGNDSLVGGAGHDSMQGGSGDDFLVGGFGNDTIDGGDGVDIATFYLAPGTQGIFSNVPGTDADAGKMLVVRTHAGGTETIAEIMVSGSFVTVTGVNSAAYLGTKIVTNVEKLLFSVVSADPLTQPTVPGYTVVNIGSLSGVVVDGYVAGATVFLDNNRNGAFDPGEASAVTDGNGDFTLTAIGDGPILAVGGVNTDTGLANEMVLSAPGGSTVINPLTTLVQAIVDQSGGATDAAAAEAQLKTALGLDPGLDLLSTDLLAEAAAGNAAALDAQKAAATVVTILAAAEDAAGNDGGEAAAVDQLAQMIADAAQSSGTVDLTDSDVIEDVLTAAAPDAPDLGSVADSVAASAQAIQEAETLEEVTSSQAEAMLTGNDLDNVLASGALGDTLTGAGGNDRLFGNGGNDRLLGGDGDDYLVGGDGFDMLYGGAGADTFVVGGGTPIDGAFHGLSVDVVFDFNARAGDVLDFGDAVLLRSELFGNINAAEKTLGGDLDGIAKPDTAKQFVTVLFGDSNEDGVADFAVALIGTKSIDATAVTHGSDAPATLQVDQFWG